jgi:DNA-binding winged helix-turn-helix (wHTH) protein/predicted ATPase
MAQTRSSDAAPVRIETDNEWAWCGERRLALPPKTFAVLQHLVERAGRLVTKHDLLAAVWGETIVGEAVLTSCIRDLRKALSDSSRAPRYIETVHRRGFRFIGPVAGSRDVAPQTSGGPAEDAKAGRSREAWGRGLPLVGREAELARLRDLLETALEGRRRLVFVTGEAGIGKTTLVETFLARIGHRGALCIGRGQCVEQYGAGEAYLPVLEALGRMGREEEGPRLVRILRQYAPTWLAQLPALLTDSDLEAVLRRAYGTTRDRMLRELIEAFDALSGEIPLVIVLEDLHWSDSATVDLLAMLARRRDAARLLILGTYRPADVTAGEHPLKPVQQELQVHGHCEEIGLEFLSEAAVGEVLAGRFPRASFPPDFVRLLRENTGGNPLFLVNAIDDLIAQGHVREADGAWTLSVPVQLVGSTVPQTLSQMVEKQIERLTPREQAVLAVASVAGAEFSAALSSVDGIDPRDGEQACDALARRGQFLRALGAEAWPDGTVAGRYGFIHAVYRNVLYARVSIGHRVALHLRIGARLESAHRANANDIAGELAMHFERGRDFERAVQYHRQAADGALRRHAYREAVEHATRALELLSALPESPERIAQELMIQTLRGAAVIATRGWGAPEVAGAYGRARELCARVGATPQLFPVLLGLCGFYLMRGELRTAQELAEQLMVVAEKTGDDAVRLGAYNTAGMASFYRGDFVSALDHFTKAGGIYDPEQHSPNRLRAFSVDHDPGVSCAAHTALTLLALGHPDRAAARMRECLVYAHSIDHPVTLVMALNFAATFYQIRRDARLVQEIEDARLVHATEHGFDLFLGLGEIYRGWLALADGAGEDGLARTRRGLAAYRAVGAALGTPTFLAIVADACARLGRRDQGLEAVSEGLTLAEETGLHYWDAELQRLQGTLLLLSEGSRDTGIHARGSSAERAECCFREAIEIARRQHAKLLELRSAMSLARLWHGQGKASEARALLSDVHGWFAEGFEAADLIEAQGLLAELADPAGSPAARRRRARGGRSRRTADAGPRQTTPRSRNPRRPRLS